MQCAGVGADCLLVYWRAEADELRLCDGRMTVELQRKRIHVRVDSVSTNQSIRVTWIFSLSHPSPLTVDALLWALRSISLCRELGPSWWTEGLWVGTPTLTYHPGSTLQH